MTDKKRARIEITLVYEDSFRWALLDGRHRMIFWSAHYYKNKRNARIAALRAKRLMAEAEIKED